MNKHSQAELTRLLELGIREVGDLDKSRFYVVACQLSSKGSPPTIIEASVLVRFLPTGAPYCCGEPSCYSTVFLDSGSVELGDYMRRRMNLRHNVVVKIKVRTEYYDGIEFSTR